MKKLIALSVMAISFNALADGHETLFKTLDTDANQMISAEEAQIHEQLAQQFSQLDVNKDSQLSLDEFRALQK
ncbi:calmodulin [Neptunomonas marina]|uniref:Calmodulin n=1 Tax=Neptunomonas marina TaxID=1815562 RepID=A0A437Q6H3_9GAMM|nr:calmodulin [Neptunomonas marina]RVU30053.1 calmodulin [Neptunomonas marina]